MMDGDRIRLAEHQTLLVRARSVEALEIESTWSPGTPPPMHWHPDQAERFEVLEGTLSVRLGEEEMLPGTGERLDVPPRTAHCMWNAGPGIARARWRITPPLRTEQQFRDMEKGVRGLQGLLLLLRYRGQFRLGRPQRVPARLPRSPRA